MSSYDGDPRVVFNGDGTATIFEGAPGEGDWTVRERFGEWIADNPEQGFLRSTMNGDYPERFGTCDEALAAFLGDPQ